MVSGAGLFPVIVSRLTSPQNRVCSFRTIAKAIPISKRSICLALAILYITNAKHATIINDPTSIPTVISALV